jgi:hypothetical protein
MKIENQTSISQLPKEISKSIQEISTRVRKLDGKLNDVHPEKIYESYNKVDEFRRELYEIDLLSQNVMQAYKYYAHLASQVMNHEDYVAPEPEEGEGLRVEGLEGDES